LHGVRRRHQKNLSSGRVTSIGEGVVLGQNLSSGFSEFDGSRARVKWRKRQRVGIFEGQVGKQYEFIKALGIVEDRRNGTAEKVAREVELNLPTYVLFSSPAAMLCVVLSLPKLLFEQQIPCKGAANSLIEIAGATASSYGGFSRSLARHV
ncbi:hypothetical protein KI387_027501, partial [Taxus chinensis]